MIPGSIHIKLLLYAMLFIAAHTSLPGQSPFDPQFAGDAARILETVQVLTDRSLYAVNEEIRFTASILVTGVNEPWSTVLYAELVDAGGETFASGKFPAGSGSSGSSLQIPAGCLTGNYLLKCYTRWMRNSGPPAFSYTPLKIINPYRRELSSPGNGEQAVSGLPVEHYQKGRLACMTDRALYRRGEEVRLLLSGDQEPGREITCCLTVVPLDAIDTTGGQAGGSSGVFGPSGFRVEFLPDPGGPSISGSLFTPEVPFRMGTGQPVRFTIMGERPDHLAVFPDGTGRFVFTPPPGRGNRELFVTPDPGSGEGAEVRIDLDFDNRPLPWQPGVFHLSGGEREAAGNIALRMQLAQAFLPDEKPLHAAAPEDSIPFYGTPVHRVLLDEFIDLPSLEEVFINLVPDVNVIRRQGSKKLKVESENSSIGIYDPLVMIDFIPVFDQEAMLKVVPERIKRIDVINQVYVRGAVSYGGLVSMISRKGDLAGIDLPGGSYFFDFQSFEPDGPVSGDPLFHTAGEAGDRIPDTRNTLVWEDNVVLSPREEVEVRLRAPEHPGAYVALLRWIAGPGEVHAAIARFTVR